MQLTTEGFNCQNIRCNRNFYQIQKVIFKYEWLLEKNKYTFSSDVQTLKFIL